MGIGRVLSNYAKPSSQKVDLFPDRQMRSSY